MHSSFLFCSFIIFVCINVIASENDKYHEELYIRPLETGHIYSYFQFTTTRETNNDTYNHYYIFPKSLGEVLQKFDVQELHLTLTESLWRHSRWGYPKEDSPTGAQLWVWFKEGSINVNEKWKDLINVLSGMFCASLNFMDNAATTIPKYSFRPWGVISQRYQRYGQQHVRYSALPGEMVCTENLTPWKKLLPCGSKFGLGSLLNSLKIYDSNFQSLGVHVRPICKDQLCTTTVQELKQTLSVVTNMAPNSLRPGIKNWSIRSVFDQLLIKHCPLANTNNIYVDIPKYMAYSLNPLPHETFQFDQNSVMATLNTYDFKQHLLKKNAFDIVGTLDGGSQSSVPSLLPPPLHATRTQTGYGQQNGGIMTLLYNEQNMTQAVIVMETIPWYLRVFLHTLKVECFPLSHGSVVGMSGTQLKPVKLNYVPGKARQHPYFLELLLQLPPLSVTRIRLDFERSLLKWTEYPPDAHHGFNVPAAVVTAVLTPEAGARQNVTLLKDKLNVLDNFIRLYTETIQVTLPTPDFSMPYNVICLTSTVVAIAFGSVHNITTRKFTVVDPNKKGLVGRTWSRVKSWFRRDKKTQGSEGEGKDKTD